MFGVEEDNAQLINQINKVVMERDAFANRVLALEKQLQGEGIPIDHQQLPIKIEALTHQLREKNQEIEGLRKQLAARVAVVGGSGSTPTPPQPIAPSLPYPPSTNTGQPGWGYRGTGGFTPINPPLQSGNGLTGNTLGYEPSGNGHTSGGLPQGAYPLPNNPEYIESVTSPETLDKNMKSKLCPVHKARGQNVYMTPAKLYGTRVDTNENGIWFDPGELLEIVSNIKGETWRDLSSVINRWKNDKDQISIQRDKLVEMRKQYDEKYQRFLQLNAIVSLGGPDKDRHISEYRALAQELRNKEAQLKKGVDITPGKTVTFGKTTLPAPGHTDLKFCPVELAKNKQIIMARVKIFGEAIDASTHGLWFDKDELVKILKIVRAKDEGIIGNIKNWLKGEGIAAAINKQVAARIAKVKERDETHAKWQEKKRLQQFGPDCEALEVKYLSLSRELDGSVDITPGWLMR